MYWNRYISEQRYWSLSCALSECCPEQGKIIDEGGSAVAARAVVAGMQVLDSRAQLDESIQPPKGETARSATIQIARAGAETAAMDLVQIDRICAEHVRKGLADPAQLTMANAAMLSVLANFPSARDEALKLLTRKNAFRHVELWSAVARLAPHDFQASVLGLCGLAAWADGNGAMQVVCAQRAERIAPDHSLVRLLNSINACAAPPSLWGKLREDLFGDADSESSSEPHRS